MHYGLSACNLNYCGDYTDLRVAIPVFILAILVFCFSYYWFFMRKKERRF
jgi:hypothetical protein